MSKLYNVKMSYRPFFVDDSAGLSDLLEILRKEREIGIDTEGNSFYSNHPEICLIQISTRTCNYVIDPIKLHDISCLGDILSNPAIEKILHGSSYDIQLLYERTNSSIRNLFDTQIAACFLGEKRTGLASLVERYFNVKLDKKYQMSNWKKRPLSDEMIEYAVSDTKYLLPLADILKEKLKHCRRIEWVKEECKELACNNKIKREKNGKRNKGNTDDTIERLKEWRIKKAKELKIEPHLVLTQRQIKNLVEIAIKKKDDIFRINCLKKWQKLEFGSELFSIICD